MEELKFYQGKENFAPSYRVRKAVFGVEQGFEHDFDEEDDTAEHLVVYKDGEPVATARCMPSGKPDGYYIGRVAVVRDRTTPCRERREADRALRRALRPSIL